MPWNRRMLGGLFLAGIVASIGAAARADNINTSGVACKAYITGGALDIDYTAYSIRNVNAGPRDVICPVPRSPLGSMAPTQFYVDGSNDPGTSTYCVAVLYNYHGEIITTESFTESVSASAPVAASWDRQVAFSIEPSTYDYVSVLCELPGNIAGRILGVTAVQP
jgi:hypothetical protein